MAYSFYLRTSRLDLDDYNHEVEDGCHITSMAGTWLTIVEGFGGMRVIKDRLHFDPQLPPGWTTISFTIRFRGNLLPIKIKKGGLRIFMYGKEDVEIIIRKTVYHIKPETEIILNH